MTRISLSKVKRELARFLRPESDAATNASIRKVTRFRLDQLLPRVRKRHLHAEMQSGGAAGREVW